MINDSTKNEKSSGDGGKITAQDSINTPGHKDKSDGLDFQDAIHSQNDYLNSHKKDVRNNSLSVNTSQDKKQLNFRIKTNPRNDIKMARLNDDEDSVKII